MTAVDLHVKVLDETVVRRAKASGLDVLVYAPHFTQLEDIEKTAERYSDDELLVVPGREVFTGTWRDRRHVLAIGLDEPVPDFITLEAAMAEFDRQNAAVLVPHPSFLTVSLEAKQIERHRDVIDAVETYNPKHWPQHNRRATSIAREFELPAFGSSYAHLPGTVGEVWTAFDREIDDAPDLVEVLRNGASRRPRHRSSVDHYARRALEFAHLGWENSAKKVDRLLLSGQEATHPEQSVYDGRFDDASVY
ncbi:PHP-associated domain containing protein [Halorhabdus tiamatea SARL4B]|uniref:PHP-associated domain containing protein n=1 Tax=Halorhabdus tiamatea SARL4B TaxID=1033806 RepID=F7PFI1_9EURY|nr:PHP-associated domain-containing protein [Halorhabdus tiamatea]ERJ06477.1 PHP-associated domain containing protein [Halorhabdus tiamatea SARL4B]CCQ34358.1 polymerase/histidinol phosphatase-like protein [Halorhabdus tiamatea SARL4B]